jgi:hypothetical protein
MVFRRPVLRIEFQDCPQRLFRGRVIHAFLENRIDGEKR